VATLTNAGGDESGIVDRAAEYFGFVIAYLLPGLVGLWAASYYSPNVKKWMAEGATHSTSLGGFLFLMVAAIGSGMLLHTFRFAVYEKFVPWVCSAETCKRLGLDRPDYNEARSGEPGVHAALANIRDQHYRYYQCHGAMSLALPAVYLAWILFTDYVPLKNVIVVGLGTLVATLVSVMGALDSHKRGRDKRIKLLGLRQTG